MPRAATIAFAAMVLGSAGLSVPTPAMSQAAGVLPSNPEDFQCFVLLQQRRDAFAQGAQLDPVQRAEFINNLTIISAFYAGRISHYSAAEAVVQFQSATEQVNGASAQQRDAFANNCANFYVSVMNVLMQTAAQVGGGTPAAGVSPTPR